MYDVKGAFPTSGSRTALSEEAIRAIEVKFAAGESCALQKGYYRYANPLVLKQEWLSGNEGSLLIGEGQGNTWLCPTDPTKPAIELQCPAGQKNWRGHVRGLGIRFGDASKPHLDAWSALAWPGGWPSKGAGVYAGMHVDVNRSSFRDMDIWSPGPMLWLGSDFGRNESWVPPSFVNVIENVSGGSAWHDGIGVYGGNSMAIRACYPGTVGLIENSGLASYRVSDYCSFYDTTLLDTGAIGFLLGSIDPVTAPVTAATASSITFDAGSPRDNLMIGQEVRLLTGTTTQGPRRVTSHTGNTFNVRPNWSTIPSVGNSAQLFSPLSAKVSGGPWKRRCQVNIFGGNVERPADYGILVPFQGRVQCFGTRFFGTQPYRAMIRMLAHNDARLGLYQCDFSDGFGASPSHGAYVVADGALRIRGEGLDETQYKNLATGLMVTIPGASA